MRLNEVTPPEELRANSKHEGGRMRNWILALAAMATLLAGCYIGKAEFRGEDMKMYPFFGTSAVPIEYP